MLVLFFFQAEDGIRDIGVTGVQTCALPISYPIVGGINESCIALVQAITSIAPAAPKRWPVIDLVELTGTSFALFFKTDLIAKVSNLSLYSVLVPCAFIYESSSAFILASLSASLIALAAPSPSGAGEVI